MIEFDTKNEANCQGEIVSRQNQAMNISFIHSRTLITILVSILAGTATLAISKAWADDGQFSLSSGFGLSPSEIGTTKSAGMPSTSAIGTYETGHWQLKVTIPYATTPDAAGIAPVTNHNTAGSPSLFGNTLAAASYNIYTGSASTMGINLTGKIKLGLADKFFGYGNEQNDYAAQADAYQSFDQFKALGSLGFKIHGNSTGISMDKVLYGSVGGAYQLGKQISGGVNFSLSQSPSPEMPGQRQISAYLSHTINNNFTAKGYLLQDLSNGIADRSIGAAVSYGF